MDFIQEVQMKTSGVEAEYGGALGGVVNVIMDKGTNHWHGSIFTSFQDGGMNGGLNAFPRYDPGSTGTITSWGTLDPDYQNYQPKRPHTSVLWPGFKFGGPLMGLFPKVIADHAGKLEDRIFLFGGFSPGVERLRGDGEFYRRRAYASQPKHPDLLHLMGASMQRSRKRSASSVRTSIKESAN